MSERGKREVLVTGDYEVVPEKGGDDTTDNGLVVTYDDLFGKKTKYSYIGGGLI